MSPDLCCPEKWAHPASQFRYGANESVRGALGRRVYGRRQASKGGRLEAHHAACACRSGGCEKQSCAMASRHLVQRWCAAFESVPLSTERTSEKRSMKERGQCCEPPRNASLPLRAERSCDTGSQDLRGPNPPLDKPKNDAERPPRRHADHSIGGARLASQKL